MENVTKDMTHEQAREYFERESFISDITGLTPDETTELLKDAGPIEAIRYDDPVDMAFKICVKAYKNVKAKKQPETAGINNEVIKAVTRK